MTGRAIRWIMGQEKIQRVNMGKAAPELYQAVLGLDKLIVERAKAAGLAIGFTHLLRLRASQLNGCAYCIRMHAHDALAAGESNDRVVLLDAWRESAYFDAKERAALQLVEAVTMVADGQVPDAVYSAAAEALTIEAIAVIEWLAVAMAAWNRIAISSRYPVAPPR
jgi:AhpD family alkylhydroperoxidase